jgi:hypothetical protein
MMLALTTYRYRSSRSDEPLLTKLVELALQKPRYGYRRLQAEIQRPLLIGRCAHHQRCYHRGGAAQE